MSAAQAIGRPEIRGRVCIGGGPGTGKTFLANHVEAVGLEVKHTDILIATHAWGDDSAEVVKWMNEPGPWIIEGIAVVRALRKHLAAHPTGRPCDLLFWATTPKKVLTPRQNGLLTACNTIFTEIAQELLKRGVDIREAP